MSLRRKLLISITLILVASLLAGGIVTYWQAARRIDVEMTSALSVASAKLRDAVRSRRNQSISPDTAGDIIGLFDGDRHIQARLNDFDGKVLAKSDLESSAQPAPRWLKRLLAGPTQERNLLLSSETPQPLRITLTTEPANEVAELWEEIKIKVLLVLGFSMLVLGVVFATLQKALQPLETLSAALGRVGAGAFGTTVPVGGPTELASIYQQFNTMSAALSALEQQNAALKAQLETVQEEERAEIARDLHDEFGPFLFAADADAQMIPVHLHNNANSDVTESATRIRQAIGHMQTHLRAILARLKPANMIDLGLVHAADHLVTFWQARRKDIRFIAKIEVESFGPAVDEVAFRIFQEGLSNAIRHGSPSTVQLGAEFTQSGEARITVIDDGTGVDDTGRHGFGLAGMAERVKSVGGTFQLTTSPGRKGVTIIAILPLHRPTGHKQRGEQLAKDIS